MSEQTAPEQDPSVRYTADRTAHDQGSAPLTPIVHEFVAAGPVDANIQNLRGDVVLRTRPGTAVRVELRPADEAGRDLARRMRVRFDQERLTVDAPADEAQRFGDLVMGLGRGTGTWGEKISRGLRSAARGVTGLAGQLDLVIEVPARSRVTAHAGAGDLSVTGDLGRLEARTGAGEIAVERGAEEATHLTTGTGDIAVGPAPGDVHATTGLGDIVLAPVTGAVRATTGTGEVVLAPVGGRIAVTTGTGGVDLAELDGEAVITTGVGGISIRRALSGTLQARSGLGDVTVRVAPGTAARVDLATGLGRRDVRLTPADGAGDAERTLVIEGRTAKGDLRVLRAEPEDAEPEAAGA
ncbi:hypothetical protein [Brachybacterium sp. sponge]|uniref:DUF4097 family beta strand repeat-containing protein n=1 Tax=Brachybacterium sp. sponge TaxID=1775432 RepID=UPI0007A4AD3A|nr:hypothetical protein [Brachybacterium sp. sponge]